MRYQRGQRVPLEVTTTGMPDALPVATIHDPDNALFGEFPLPYSGAGLSFAYALRLPGGVPLGTYQVAISYSVAGDPGSTTSTFDVVAGGDSGGEVISLHSYDRPEARFLLAQLASGKLVQGKNPHL